MAPTWPDKAECGAPSYLVLHVVLARLLSVDDRHHPTVENGRAMRSRQKRTKFVLRSRCNISYVPMGAGHHIGNTGSGILRLLIGFNNGHYHSHGLSAWVASNPCWLPI
jgi:hypothetical protein